MHDLTDAYNAAISAATEAYYAALTLAWNDQQAKLEAARETFERARELRMATFYAGPAALPKADLPEGIKRALETAVGTATEGAADGDEQAHRIAAE